MKTNILLIALMSISTILFGQVPQGIPYQAVARDAQGNPMSNQSLTVQFSLHEASADGQVVYQETQTTTTNGQGLFSLTFGTGVPSVGTFANINWGSGYKFLQVQANFGNGYVDLGTQQLMSVPYALYSGSAQNITNNQNLSIGQDYQGGKIFYLDKTGIHGLIISDTIFVFNGPFFSLNWGPTTTSSIYGGRVNTKYLSRVGDVTPDAFDFAENLVLNDYSDWFIPSRDELLEAYFNLDVSFFSDVLGFGGLMSSTFFSVEAGCTTYGKWQVATLYPDNSSLFYFMDLHSGDCTYQFPSNITTSRFKVVREF